MAALCRGDGGLLCLMMPGWVTEDRMTVLHDIRMGLRRWGIDLNRYRPAQSAEARLLRLMQSVGTDAIVDVGANDGGYVRAIRGAGFGGPVLSFEPLAQAHARLLQAAAGQAHWQVAPRMALGEAAGSATIHVAGNSTSSSLLPMHERHAEAAPQSRYVSGEQVTVGRLDEVPHPLLERARAMHLKIDTQGYEMPVLRGATGLLPRVATLQIELSLVPLYEGQALYRAVIDWLDERGFELCGVVPGFTDERSGRMLQMDGVFARST